MLPGRWLFRCSRAWNIRSPVLQLVCRFIQAKIFQGVALPGAQVA
jgi:hypothetical protein